MKVASNSLLDFFWGNENQSIVQQKDGIKFSKNCFGIDFVDQVQKHNIHYKYKDIVKKFDIPEIDQFKFVTSIRNPYEHAMSWYLFQRVMFDTTEIKTYIARPKRFFKALYKTNNRSFFKWSIKNKYEPYTDWFKSDKKKLIDYYLRVENINEDLKVFAEDFNLNYDSIKTLNKNSSHNNELYDSLYDEESKEYIKNIYKDIFENFDYCFPNE